ncbi:MAG TPA: hypothetical protein VJT49_23090 [Amycolatopsis sp.]|uniref:hypothetical protein n=1 Tax=Amycolatopsis sp. TaxID=37632 RepID=UPI002B4683EE|nr:hypothetical protein [Amycolatopsis sp.]HKS47943.1 hypothetical protein [Amycolatopsis sp.]
MIKKLLAGLLLGVVVLFAAPAAPAASASTSIGVVAQQATAPPGPRIDPADTDKANAQKTKSKVVVGVTAVVLLGIVVWGRSIRRKRRKSADDQAKGK